MAHLAGYDFGTFFRTVRGLTTWSQQTSCRDVLPALSAGAIRVR